MGAYIYLTSFLLQVAEDQNIIDVITAQYNISLQQQEDFINSSNMRTNFNINVNAMSNEIQSKLVLGDEYQKDPNSHYQPPVSPATPLENTNVPVTSPALIPTDALLNIVLFGKDTQQSLKAS